MEIENLTVKQIREIQSLLGTTNETTHPYKIGKGYFIRTVTHHYTGRLIRVLPQELVLEDVAWIADDGRFSEALKTGEFNEVEPYPDGEVIIGRGSILDAFQINSKLPRSQQ